MTWAWPQWTVLAIVREQSRHGFTIATLTAPKVFTATATAINLIPFATAAAAGALSGAVVVLTRQAAGWLAWPPSRRRPRYLSTSTCTDRAYVATFPRMMISGVLTMGVLRTRC